MRHPHRTMIRCPECGHLGDLVASRRDERLAFNAPGGVPLILQDAEIDTCPACGERYVSVYALAKLNAALEAADYSGATEVRARWDDGADAYVITSDAPARGPSTTGA